jgi:hypothetical protein
MLNTTTTGILLVLILVYLWMTKFAVTTTTEPFYGPDSQGDLVLRNLYRRIHNLEAISRVEIAQNNDFAGGDHGISKERLAMEHIAREIARLKSYARQEIAKRRQPFRIRNKPPLGYDFNDCYHGDCQLKMDYNERILGIPSVPGNTHSYHYNRKFNSLRVPNTQQEAEDMHMV